MVLFLTPRFAPAYTATPCSPWSCIPARPLYSNRVSRPHFPSFVPFLSQVDDLLSELDLELRREAKRQRQRCKRTFRAHFHVQENTEGYQIDGEIPGFKQEDIEIQVTDEHTLKVAGKSKTVEHQTRPGATTAPRSQATESQSTETVANESKEVSTLDEPEQEIAVPGAATPARSVTESHKSYHATVEDDFEDLGAEISSTFSVDADALAKPRESKAIGATVEEITTNETTVQQQPQPTDSIAHQQHADCSSFQASFERSFRFPERIDAVNVSASLRNGSLSITVPKTKTIEVRRILIQ